MRSVSSEKLACPIKESLPGHPDPFRAGMDRRMLADFVLPSSLVLWKALDFAEIEGHLGL
jgi:hypothetical protein